MAAMPRRPPGRRTGNSWRLRGTASMVPVPPAPPAPPAATSPSPTASITVTPDSINPGGSAVLAWKTTEATEISIDGIGTVNAYGTQNVTPAETTNYHLVARGPGGS